MLRRISRTVAAPPTSGFLCMQRSHFSSTYGATHMMKRPVVGSTALSCTLLTTSTQLRFNSNDGMGQDVGGSWQKGRNYSEDPYNEQAHANFAVEMKVSSTVPSIWASAVKAYGQRRFMGNKMWVRGRLGYIWSTYESMDQEIESVRFLLHKLGLGKTERIAVVSENRYELFAITMAATQLGAQVLVLPTNITPSEAKQVVKNSHTKVMIVETIASLTAVKNWVGHVGELEHVLCLEQQSGEESYAIAINLASEALAQKKVELGEGAEHPVPVAKDLNPDDTALVCFTAGTTGPPKGVMLSHKSLVANMSSTAAGLGEAFTHNDLFASLLSWTNVAGITGELFQVIIKGASIAIPPDMREGFMDLPTINPTVIVSVALPLVRAYNNIFDDIMGAGVVSKQMYHATLGFLTEARTNYQKPGLLTKTMSQAMLGSYKAQFGERLRCMVVVGAGFHHDHVSLFHDLDLYVVQTYSCTEAGGILATDVDVSTRLKMLPGVELRVVNDLDQVVVPGDIGEILVEAPHAMQGYFHTHIDIDANQNAMVLYGNRTFVRTGDFGTLTGNWLTVKGNKDVLITLKNGKVVDPCEAELVISKSPFIRQIFLYGDGRDYVVALINPVTIGISNFLKKWDRRDGQPVVSDREKADVVRTEIRKFLADIPDARVHPRRFAFVDEFTQSNGFLTNRYTLCRDKIQKHYVHYLDALYDDSPKFFGFAVDDYDDLF